MNESIVNLNDGRPVDPRQRLKGAWRSFQVRRLEPGESTELVADMVEHAAYVLRGRGTARSGGDSFAVATGTAITIPLGDRVSIQIGGEPMDLFVCTLEA